MPVWQPCDHFLRLFYRSVLDNFHAAMNAVNDPDIAAVAESLQLAQDAILSDSKQLAGQFVARLYEVRAINTSLANCIDQPYFHCRVYNDNREVKHDVNGRRQTAKITSDFEFFSSIP